MKTNEFTHNNSKAIIILHEIYGVNSFIKKVGRQYFDKNYDAYCLDLLDGTPPYQYTQSEEAYGYFIQNIGFDIYHEVSQLIDQLKMKYDKVLLIGFSIGATIAWRCTENANCDGVVCYYGSRIRDYLEVLPQCPSLLIFAKEDSFDVKHLASVFEDNANIMLEIIDGKHGFMDYNSERYLQESSDKAIKITEQFLRSVSRVSR